MYQLRLVSCWLEGVCVSVEISKLLVWKEYVYQLSKENLVHWYWLVLRRVDENTVKNGLKFDKQGTKERLHAW